MIHLDCEELKQGLAKKAKNYAEKLLERMITTHRQQTLKLVTFVNFQQQKKLFSCNYNSQNFCEIFFFLWRICSEFETIRETALKTPETTEDIIQLIDFINYTKAEGIEELKEKIQVSAGTLTPSSSEAHSSIVSNGSVPLCALTGRLLQTVLPLRRSHVWEGWNGAERNSFCVARQNPQHLSALWRGIAHGPAAAGGNDYYFPQIANRWDLFSGYWDSQGERDGWADGETGEVKGAAGKGLTQDCRVPVLLRTGHDPAGWCPPGLSGPFFLLPSWKILCFFSIKLPNWKD